MHPHHPTPTQKSLSRIATYAIIASVILYLAFQIGEWAGKYFYHWSIAV